jgi:hypothetical protein
VDEHVVAVATFAGGGAADWCVSWQAGPTHVSEVVGTDGVMRIQNARGDGPNTATVLENVDAHRRCSTEEFPPTDQFWLQLDASVATSYAVHLEGTPAYTLGSVGSAPLAKRRESAVALVKTGREPGGVARAVWRLASFKGSSGIAVGPVTTIVGRAEMGKDRRG